MPEIHFDKDGRHVFPYPGIEIRYDQETEVVNHLIPVKKPDPAWTHFDSNGHAHAWKKNKLPTLVEVKTGTITYGDEYDGYDEVDQTEYRCKVCEEVVEPSYRTDFSPQYVAGPPRYTLVIGGSFEYPIQEDDVKPLYEILKRCGVMNP